MNVVFWLGVLIAAAILWYLLSKSFFNIGSSASDMIEELKQEIKETKQESEDRNDGE